MKRPPSQRVAIRCQVSHNLLAYRDERGIYLFCKECRTEQIFAWSEIVPRSLAASEIRPALDAKPAP
ncbi:MAG TPA: hypothetical protein VGT44_23210 [Ktedonobacteraceae bacterium]|nr:hypothetical protein [Ktedonobacteraceae bacterium]